MSPAFLFIASVSSTTILERVITNITGYLTTEPCVYSDTILTIPGGSRCLETMSQATLRTVTQIHLLEKPVNLEYFTTWSEKHGNINIYYKADVDSKDEKLVAFVSLSNVIFAHCLFLYPSARLIPLPLQHKVTKLGIFQRDTVEEWVDDSILDSVSYTSLTTLSISGNLNVNFLPETLQSLTITDRTTPIVDLPEPSSLTKFSISSKSTVNVPNFPRLENLQVVATLVRLPPVLASVNVLDIQGTLVNESVEMRSAAEIVISASYDTVRKLSLPNTKSLDFKCRNCMNQLNFSVFLGFPKLENINLSFVEEEKRFFTQIFKANTKITHGIIEESEKSTLRNLCSQLQNLQTIKINAERSCEQFTTENKLTVEIQKSRPWPSFSQVFGLSNAKNFNCLKDEGTLILFHQTQ